MADQEDCGISTIAPRSVRAPMLYQLAVNSLIFLILHTVSPLLPRPLHLNKGPYYILDLNPFKEILKENFAINYAFYAYIK